MSKITDFFGRMLGRKPARRDAYAGTYGAGSGGGFAGGAVNRLTSSLASWSGSVNLDLDASLVIVRARARALAQNNEYGRRFLSQVASNVVGRTGPMLQVRAMMNQRDPSKPTQLDKAANDAIEIHYQRWGKTADITGKMTLAQLQRVAAKAVARDGEALIRKVRRRDLPYGIALQLLEADRLDETITMSRLQNGGSIRMGVELDSTGRPVAFYVKTSHPGDRFAGSVKEVERVPAADLVHLYLPERAEQVRGYSWFHAIILRASQLHDFNDAAVIAAKVGASKIAVLQRPEDGNDMTPTMADAKTAAGNLQMDVQAGEMFELPPGYTLNSWNPEYPHANFASFQSTALHGLAAGLDVAHHNLSGDMNGVNYSSARIAELAEREIWLMLQDWFICSFVEPVYQEWLALALLRGDITFEVSGKALPADKYAKFSNASRFQGRRWRWVDPAKEIDANTKAVELGVTSRTRIAAEQGDDFEDVLDELTQEDALLSAAGLKTGAAKVVTSSGGLDGLEPGQGSGEDD